MKAILQFVELLLFSALRTRGLGYSQKNWVGVRGPLPKTLTLFMTKLCDFPYPIYDLTRNLIPYLWPLRLAQLL